MIALCVVCTAVDVIIHLIRWRPMQVWASFFRRLRGKGEEQAEPEQNRQPTTAVRREWYYPDGTARTEEVYLPEEEAYSQQPVWEQPAAYGRASKENLSERYMRSFARPEAAQVHPAVASKPIEYEDYPVAPLPGESFLPMKEEEAAPVEPAPEPQLSRSKRVLQRMARLPKDFGMLDDGDDELQLRYRPAPPAMDKEQAYHAPVYPTGWKPPATGAVLHQEESK